MVIDQTGGLSGVTRHDYLPFGEELAAGMGGRTQGLGYAAGGVRQKFTGYERDGETGLDYAQARYYANAQGRFTGVDPGNAGAVLSDPQSWNGYSYALNSPLAFTDPSGLSVSDCSAEFSYEQCGGASGARGGNFGDDVAMFADLRGASSDLRAGLLRYEYGVNNAAHHSGDGNSVLTYFDIHYWLYADGTLETQFDIDGGTVGGYNPLWELAREMNRRPIKGTFGVLYGGSVFVGGLGGVGLYTYTSAAALSAAEQAFANGLYRYSINQLTNIYRGTQREALSKLFGNGVAGARSALANLPQRIPPELTRQTLIIYRELAKRAIASGKPSATQLERLKVIEKALEIMK